MSNTKELEGTKVQKNSEARPLAGTVSLVSVTVIASLGILAWYDPTPAVIVGTSIMSAVLVGLMGLGWVIDRIRRN